MDYDSTKDCDAEYDSSFLGRKLNNIVEFRKKERKKLLRNLVRGKNTEFLCHLLHICI